MKLGKRFMAICFVIAATFSLNMTAPAVSAAALTKGTVTAKALNVRSGPGKTYKKVGTLKKGSAVTIVSSTKAGWKKVKYKSRTGYVSGKYLKMKK